MGKVEWSARESAKEAGRDVSVGGEGMLGPNGSVWLKESPPSSLRLGGYRGGRKGVAAVPPWPPAHPAAACRPGGLQAKRATTGELGPGTKVVKPPVLEAASDPHHGAVPLPSRRFHSQGLCLPLTLTRSSLPPLSQGTTLARIS